MRESLTTEKDIRWQIARGIAILCVILIHCPNAIHASKDSVDFNSWLILRQFINFPVALFFFIAGKFMNYEKYMGYRSFLSKRGGVRLLIPFLIWSIFYVLIHSAKTILSGNKLPIETLVSEIITGKSAPHLYYIVVLLQLTVITPLMLKCIGKGQSRLLYAITPIWMIFIYYWCYSRGTLPPMYQSMFPVWIGFYAWGLESRIKNVKGLTNPILAGIVVVIEIIEAYFSLKHGCPANFACSQIRVSSFLLALVIIKLFIGVQRSTVDNRFFKALAYLGDRSYGIYYIHYFFILLCAKVCKSVTLSFFGINWLSQSALSFVMALLGSLIAISVGRKLLSYLGIERVAEILGF